MNEYQEQSAEGGGEISKYNDAGLSIARLHEHWTKCEEFANNGELIRWKFRLDSIWRELTPDVQRIMNKNMDRGKELIKTNYNLSMGIGKSKNSSELYSNINKRHEFLRRLQDESGKASVYVDPDDEGFD